METLSLKNRDLKQFSLEDLHQESQTWLSTIAFWKDEVRFMHNLINKNFVYFFTSDEKGSLNALIKKLTEIEKARLDTLKTKVVNHEKRLFSDLKTHTELDKQNFRKEHLTILKDFYLFQNNYRLIKSELFRVAEKAMKEKNMKQLVS
jgi:hypothetical protein